MNAIFDFFNTYWSLEILIQLAIPILMLCHSLPRRTLSAIRTILVATTLVAICVIPLATGLITGLNVIQSFFVFSALLLLFVAVILFVFDVSVWTALLCATAGYTLQNLASGTIVLFQMVFTGSTSGTLDEPWETIMELIVLATVYVFGYVFFVQRVDSHGLLYVENRLLVVMLAAVVVIIIGFDLLLKQLVFEDVQYSTLVLLRIVFPLVCTFVLFCEYELLYSKRMKEEKAETEAILAERERQYQLSRANIEAINIKCHDIRHQIHALGESGAVIDPKALADIEHEVNIYDSVVETGNEALDTILTEKSLTCSSRGIMLSVIADGKSLSFMEAADIYSLFGNALDNAIEATTKLNNPEANIISLLVERRGDMVAVNVENYYDSSQALQFEDGLPRSTKGDNVNHGFGTRSMRSTVQRYGGSFHVGTEGTLFYLNALIPYPE